MRNLTQEAITITKQIMVQMNPRLADSNARKSLHSIEKELLVQQMISTASMVENQLVREASMR